jgi:DNA replication protein DnaC
MTPDTNPGMHTSGVPTAGIPSPPPLDAGLEALLRQMRLPHIRRVAPEVLATAKAQRWDPTEVLRVLLTEEVAGRDRSALATRRARAAFPTGKTFDAWDEALSCIPVPTQTALRTLEWIDRAENLVVCGPAGTGKTFLLEALGQQAVAAGKHVAWFTLEHLGVIVRRHRGDDSVTKAITRILRADLVIVDDIGLLAVGSDAVEGLYRLVDAADEKRSVAVSSNLHGASGVTGMWFRPGDKLLSMDAVNDDDAFVFVVAEGGWARRASVAGTGSRVGPAGGTGAA